MTQQTAELRWLGSGTEAKERQRIGTVTIHKSKDTFRLKGRKKIFYPTESTGGYILWDKLKTKTDTRDKGYYIIKNGRFNKIQQL